MLSFLKDYFPLSKIVIMMATLAPFIFGLCNYYDVLFTDKSPFKRIVNKNIKATIGTNFTLIEINEDNQKKIIKFDCTKKNCGLKNIGEYVLHTIEYAKVKNYTAFL